MSDARETQVEAKRNAVSRLEAWAVEPFDVGISRCVRISLQNAAGELFQIDADAASARDLSDRLLMAAARSVPGAGVEGGT